MSDDKQQRANEDGKRAAEALADYLIFLAGQAIEQMGQDGSLPWDPRLSLVRQLTNEGKLPTWSFVRVAADVIEQQPETGDSPRPVAAEALLAVAKLEAMLTRTDRHDAWAESQDDALGSAALLGMLVGLLANKAFGLTAEELLKKARSQFAKEGQAASAGVRASWRAKAIEHLEPILRKKPWLSDNNVAKEMETQEALALYGKGEIRPPDRIAVARWVGKARKTKALPQRVEKD